jgi:deoxyribose-phosphate aldolase
MSFTYAEVAKMIDHALLSPSLTQQELEQGCRMAKAYDIASVCIMPYYLRRCSDILRGSTVHPSTTIGFPHGGHATATKAAEARQAIRDGGEELDMVVNISQVLSRNWDYVTDDIRAVVETAHEHGKKAKVIFENAYLQNEHKIRLCEISTEIGADWVKTSTGFAAGGATLDDLALMIENVRPPVQVKAAGGIRDLNTLLKARELGVTRCGASATAAILDEARRQLGLPAIEAPAVSAVGGY